MASKFIILHFAFIIFMELNLTDILPLPEAVRSFDERTPVGTALRTAEIEKLPLALRKRAFFSAGLESARVAQKLKKGLDRTIKQFGVNRDRASFVMEMQAMLEEEGLRPTDGMRGTLQDIGSERRLRLIYDTQTRMARGEARWRTGQSFGALNSAPALELIRVRASEVERDWPQRWLDAGGEFYAGRMIALKTDPIWIAISRFDQPWPPFDFGSGMGVKNVRRREAIELGLIKKGQRLEPVINEFDAAIESSLQGLSEPFEESLQTFFGKTVELKPDGKKLELVKTQAPPLQHVVRIAADSTDTSRIAAIEGMEAIDQVHGIDDTVEPINVMDEIDEPFDFIEEIGQQLWIGRKSKERKALDEAIAKSKPLQGVSGSKDELRANAYAQFISDGSADTSFLKTLYWDPLSFLPIRNAFRTLLKALDWLR